jgi:hypothetical protein
MPERRTEMSGRQPGRPPAARTGPPPRGGGWGVGVGGTGTRMPFDVTRAFSVGVREFGSRWSGASHQFQLDRPRPPSTTTRAAPVGQVVARPLPTRPARTHDGCRHRHRAHLRRRSSPRRPLACHPNEANGGGAASAKWRTGIRDRPDERRLEERRVSCVKPSPQRSSLFFACRSRQLVVTTRPARTLWTRPRQSQVGRDQSRQPVQPKGMSATSPAAPRSQPVMTR